MECQEDYQRIFQENVHLLSSRSIGCLSLVTKSLLSTALNASQVLTEEELSSLKRDASGLAEYLDLPYALVNHDQDIMKKIFESKDMLTIQQLVQGIESIGRFDVLDDVMPFIVEDASTMDDVVVVKQHQELQDYSDNQFDAYLCYADSDYDFVSKLTSLLEVDFGLKLFVRQRDLLAGSLEYESFTRLIDKICRRVIVILSPEFLDCKECDFQAKFATSIGYDKNSVRKVIPIILSSKISLPPSLQVLSKIDCCLGIKSLDQKWTRDKLYASLRDDAHHPRTVTPSSSIKEEEEEVARKSSEITHHQLKGEEEDALKENSTIKEASNPSTNSNNIIQVNNKGNWFKNLLFSKKNSSSSSTSFEENIPRKHHLYDEKNSTTTTTSFLLLDNDDSKD